MVAGVRFNNFYMFYDICTEIIIPSLYIYIYAYAQDCIIITYAIFALLQLIWDNMGPVSIHHKASNREISQNTEALIIRV